MTQDQVRKIAGWRGLPREFVQWASDAGIIAIHKGRPAFPVPNGFHCRRKDGEWYYTKGAKPDLFKIGELEEGANIHVFESQWDALAFASVFDPTERNNIVATRGSA